MKSLSNLRYRGDPGLCTPPMSRLSSFCTSSQNDWQPGSIGLRATRSFSRVLMVVTTLAPLNPARDVEDALQLADQILGLLVQLLGEDLVDEHAIVDHPADLERLGQVRRQGIAEFLEHFAEILIRLSHLRGNDRRAGELVFQGQHGEPNEDVEDTTRDGAIKDVCPSDHREEPRNRRIAPRPLGSRFRTGRRPPRPRRRLNELGPGIAGPVGRCHGSDELVVPHQPRPGDVQREPHRAGPLSWHRRVLHQVLHSLTFPLSCQCAVCPAHPSEPSTSRQNDRIRRIFQGSWPILS